MSLSSGLSQLGLRCPPIAIRFVTEVPAGMPRVDRPSVAGCSFWKLARQQMFYATIEDHFGCPIGAHVLGAHLPEEKSRELEQLLGTMQQLSYLRSEDVATLPRMQREWVAVVYAPWDLATFLPDVVLVVGRARQMMLLCEAIEAVGVKLSPVSGRPACGTIPAVLQTGQAMTNLGCIGNRVYTDLNDDEFYVALPGACWAEVEKHLPTAHYANQQSEQYHCGRKELQVV